MVLWFAKLYSFHTFFSGHGNGSVMGCSNGLGPGIANLDEVLTDNDSDSCNALTPASLHRGQQQQHYQSTFTNPASSSYNNVIGNTTNSSSGHAHFNHTQHSSLLSSFLCHCTSLSHHKSIFVYCWHHHLFLNNNVLYANKIVGI